MGAYTGFSRAAKTVQCMGSIPHLWQNRQVFQSVILPIKMRPR